MGSIMPPIEQWVETGRAITRRVRKTYATEVGVLFDVIEALESNMNTFESVFGVSFSCLDTWYPMHVDEHRQFQDSLICLA